MPERQALLEAAAKLQAATEELTSKFEAVDVFAHETAAAHDRTRLLTRWILVGLLTHLVIIVVLAVTFDRANDANSRSVRTAEYDIANCEAANNLRAQDREFWINDILAAIAPPGSGQGAKAFVVKLKPKVEKRYAPRDCAAVAEGKVQ